MIDYFPYGDHAVLINFNQEISEEINAQVIAFYNAILEANLEEIIFQIPAYCSLTVGYNQERINYNAMVDKLKEIHNKLEEVAALRDSRLLHIPVCYEDEFAPDLQEVIATTGIDRNEIIEVHSKATYRVYMLGFLPGFPYLGKLPDALYTKRRATPRLKVPEGAVGLAGLQTGIYPIEAPGGWKIIGRTPLPIFNISPDILFLFEAGDMVKFEAVSGVAFDAIRKDINDNAFNWSTIYG